MLRISYICLKCSPPTDHVSRVTQAGRPFVRGLPAETMWHLKLVCRSHSLLQMGSILACSSACVRPSWKEDKVTEKIRLGHCLLCLCMCVCQCHGHSIALLSRLRMAFICLVCTPCWLENCVFDVINVKRQWNWTARAVITLAWAPLQFHLRKQLVLGCLLVCFHAGLL